MPRPSIFSALILTGLLFVGNAVAQTPDVTKPAAPAAKKAQAPAAKTSTTPSLALQKDKFSYALGMNVGTNLGTNLKKQGMTVNVDLIARGLKDSMAGSKTLITEDEARAVLMAVQAEFQQQQRERTKQLGESNKAEGATFLAANKNKDGVVTLPSGLQYKILTPGTGPKPAATDTVTVNYRGTLINGTEFDSSYKRSQPATFAVTGVIKGWTEALQLMPTGSKWQLVIPSDLAYGERGAGTDIAPNATLIFEVELLSIKAPEKAADKPEDKKPEEKKEDKK